MSNPETPNFVESQVEELNKINELNDDEAMKYIKINVQALSMGARLHTRNLLNMLCQHGVDGKTKRQIRETIERAIIAAFDYGVEAFDKEMPVRTHGKLGKLEVEYAQTLAKLKEMGMLLMAKKMESNNPENQRGDSGGEKVETKEQNVENETSV